MSLSKNVTRVFPRTHPGGTRTLNSTLALNEKFPSKFFGYVQSSAVSSILSLSKNFTRHFFRIHPGGGNRTLNRTVGFKKKIPWKFFGYVQSTVVSWILSLSKNVTRVLPRTHPGGPELSTELLHLTKNSLWNFLGMFKALQFLRFWVYQKILLDFFVELIRGEQNSEQNCWIWNKIPPKFFGFVRSTVVSWIVSLSKNVTTVFPRTHPGGTRTLNRTLAFNKKFRLKFFGYV